MGRELRRVPVDWEHPRDERGEYIPLYGLDVEAAWAEWEENRRLWLDGKHIDQQTSAEAREYDTWDQWQGAPPGSPLGAEQYRTRVWTPEEATAYQVYEVVTEGTPISPVCATLDDLRAWLLGQGVSEFAADYFIEKGEIPSGLIVGGKSATGFAAIELLAGPQ